MQPPDVSVRFETRGTVVSIRPISPADEAMEAAFVRNLSTESRYLRFHSGIRELTPELLARFTRVDFPDTMALIATVEADGVATQIGVARYATSPPASDTAEVAIVVADDWQGAGVGTRLLLELRTVARAAGIRHLQMRVLPQNRRMIDLARRLGYEPVSAGGDFGSRMLGKSLRGDGDPDP